MAGRSYVRLALFNLVLAQIVTWLAFFNIGYTVGKGVERSRTSPHPCATNNAAIHQGP
jgi:hypothetical protein